MKALFGLMAAILLLTDAAQAGETEFAQCEGKAANSVIREANCDLAIRLGDLSPEQLAVARFNRGQANLILQHPAKALEDFKLLVEQAPDDMGALLNRGIALRQLKQFDAAIADFDRLLQLNYEPAAQVYLNRAMTYFKKGDKENTMADLQKAQSLAPGDKVIADRLWKTRRYYAMQAGETPPLTAPENGSVHPD